MTNDILTREEELTAEYLARLNLKPNREMMTFYTRPKPTVEEMLAKFPFGFDAVNTSKELNAIDVSPLEYSDLKRLCFYDSVKFYSTPLHENGWSKKEYTEYTEAVAKNKAAFRAARIDQYRDKLIAKYNLDPATSDDDLELMYDSLCYQRVCEKCTYNVDGRRCIQSVNYHTRHFKNLPACKPLPVEFEVVDGKPKYIYHFERASCAKCLEFDRAKEVRKRLIAANVPQIYIDNTLDDFIVDDDNRQAADFARKGLEEGFKRGVYVYGDVGVGKTMLLSLIARTIYEQAIKAEEYDERKKDPRGFSSQRIYIQFTTMSYLIMRLQHAIGKSGKRKRDDDTDDPKPTTKSMSKSKTAANIIEEAASVSVLFLDDFAVGTMSPYFSEQMFNIINMRYERGLLTFLSSNYTPRTLLERISARSKRPDGDPEELVNMKRILSRLSTMVEFIEIKGADRRLMNLFK